MLRWIAATPVLLIAVSLHLSRMGLRRKVAQMHHPALWSDDSGKWRYASAVDERAVSNGFAAPPADELARAGCRPPAPGYARLRNRYSSARRYIFSKNGSSGLLREVCSVFTCSQSPSVNRLVNRSHPKRCGVVWTLPLGRAVWAKERAFWSSVRNAWLVRLAKRPKTIRHVPAAFAVQVHRLPTNRLSPSDKLQIALAVVRKSGGPAAFYHSR